MSGGDELARGARSAVFGPPQVSKEKWDAIWAEAADTIHLVEEQSGRNDVFKKFHKVEK